MNPDHDPLLEVTDLHAYLGDSHILQGVRLTVPRHRVTVLLGRNGVGKTTTMRAVLGLVRRTGRVVFAGDEIGQEETHDIVRRGIGYVPEDRDVFHGLTVGENLRIAERRGGRPRYDLVYELFPELKNRTKHLAGTLSGGQQQMLSLARGLLNDNDLLLIDEPTKGLAPVVVREVVDVLERTAGQTTVLMVEQNLAVARRLADHIAVMVDGAIVLNGPATRLADDDETVRAYLSVESAISGAGS
ncbi:ABC transporter ATP-binding protein [Planotetraspora kaengkrachanensis]|uniref:ABC transporter ATP-binding protein n=1 Tax=Planotetraspora kaengkrachanensis TaxID=575193 RepID=A0A8J3M3U3_9ACTN|nr:ABC transporter ATP-binding protein [Planotetraspora kaengkrachanensis]GIG78670.1 ABC transporter ATP-binding protein [Planotetraspora kaengkrachanensis]